MNENCCSQPLAGSAVCELPSAAVQKKEYAQSPCPECGQGGKMVQGQTVKAQLSVTLRSIEDTDYYFCRTSSCPVVYYSQDGSASFTTAQLREHVYQKEAAAGDALVCYCFRHSLADIRAASHTGRLAILENINAGIHAGQCACDLRNPQGSCCLGNVRGLLKRLDQAEKDLASPEEL